MNSRRLSFILVVSFAPAIRQIGPIGPIRPICFALALTAPQLASSPAVGNMVAILDRCKQTYPFAGYGSMSEPNFERRTFLKGMATGAGALAMAGAESHAQPPHPKRNVLLYIVDDQGHGDAGCYGNPAIRTPGLDALASEGTRMTYAYCTTPSCSASRSVLLTGMYNHATGQYGHAHDYHHFVSFPKLKTLPVLLGNAGYRTLCAGKYHVAPEEVYHFQDYRPVRAPIEMADNCRDFIAAESDQPFFIYFCTVEPHRPFKREGSDTFSPDYVIVPPFLPDIPECREELAQYYGSVQRADLGLVRLIEILKETGHWDDTLVIFLSDNGIAFPGAKTCVYEPGIRLPCVVRNPLQEVEGNTCDAMVNWTDITPTILDYAGVQVPDHAFHGRSFLDALPEESPEGWDETYASHTFHEITMYYPNRVIIERQYKLIWNIAYGLSFPFASDLWEAKTWQAVRDRNLTHYGKRPVEAYLHRPEFELYDLQADPDEVNNLAGEIQFKGVLERLKNKLRSFQERTQDPWVLKWAHE